MVMNQYGFESGYGFESEYGFESGYSFKSGYGLAEHKLNTTDLCKKSISDNVFCFYSNCDVLHECVIISSEQPAGSTRI